MRTKKASLIIGAVVCSVLLVIAGTGVGCYYAGKASSPSSESAVVSYASTESNVYSSTAEVVSAVADTVVEISTESITTQWGKQYIVSGAGSGVIVGKSASTYYVITNNHVINGASEITARTRSGETYSATLVATDDSADVAVVKITSENTLKVAVWGNSDSLKIGEDLIAIGNPLGSLGGTVTKGILSATGRKINVGNYAMTLLQTDTAINPGNSGGGLFNMRGELIGVVNAKTTDEEIEGICFAIPGNTAKAVYEDLTEYGYIKGRASFPIEVSQGTISTGILNTQTQTVIYVSAVSDAPEGTFRQYDKIYKINGVEITSVLDYNCALADIAPGDEAEIEVYRGTVTSNIFGSSISFESESTTFTIVASQYGA